MLTCITRVGTYAVRIPTANKDFWHLFHPNTEYSREDYAQSKHILQVQKRRMTGQNIQQILGTSSEA